jgi:hypothetical protein
MPSGLQEAGRQRDGQAGTESESQHASTSTSKHPPDTSHGCRERSRQLSVGSIGCCSQRQALPAATTPLTGNGRGCSTSCLSEGGAGHGCCYNADTKHLATKPTPFTTHHSISNSSACSWSCVMAWPTSTTSMSHDSSRSFCLVQTASAHKHWCTTSKM